ncbi:hypothetical protein AVEN_207285-1 [Araneus ventricosus]|uniref:Uncharacterized protein n=1 Tax=Araneus ventricosus TaxID=182803 RepID=A0A4Y2MPC3_ARAVE|nr:hypothetical protein AVEN_244308-1 [Araneus ventricosus]GBN28287.1 hypothetical protein AVEN_207285-1 [Araneus ventricosus]
MSLPIEPVHGSCFYITIENIVPDKCSFNFRKRKSSLGQREAIRHKHFGMLSDGAILLHGNTHTARKIAAKVQVGSLEPPPYSSNLAQNLFSKHISGTRFSSNSDAKTSAENWLSRQGRDFGQACLNKLVLSSDKCLNRFGDYVEK